MLYFNLITLEINTLIDSTNYQFLIDLVGAALILQLATFKEINILNYITPELLAELPWKPCGSGRIEWLNNWWNERINLLHCDGFWWMQIIALIMFVCSLPIYAKVILFLKLTKLYNFSVFMSHILYNVFLPFKTHL